MTVVKVRDTESTSGDVRPHESREVGAHHEIAPVLADPVRREPAELHETIDQMDLLQLVADPQIPLLPRGPQELRRPLVGILPREIDSLADIAPALRRPSAEEGPGTREVSLHPFGGDRKSTRLNSSHVA